MISTSGWFRAASTLAGLGDAVFLGACRGGLLEEVGDDVDLEVGEDRQVVQVLLADVARADDGDAHRAPAGWLLRGARMLMRPPGGWPDPLCRKARLWAMPSKMSPGVVVEFHHSDFQGLGGAMTSNTAHLALPRRLLGLGVGGNRAVLDVDELYPVAEALQQLDRVLAAHGSPVGVHLKDYFGVQESTKYSRAVRPSMVDSSSQAWLW